MLPITEDQLIKFLRTHISRKMGLKELRKDPHYIHLLEIHREAVAQKGLAELKRASLWSEICFLRMEAQRDAEGKLDRKENSNGEEQEWQYSI